MASNTLQSLKLAFYDWMGTLSIEEICSNPALIEELKRIQRLLSSAQLQRGT